MTLQYPIVDTAVNAPMKAIPLQHIPTFHGLTSEDPDAFLFEFDVLRQGETTVVQHLDGSIDCRDGYANFAGYDRLRHCKGSIAIIFSRWIRLQEDMLP